MARPHTDEPPAYSGERARGAEIVLRKPWERGVFIAGLARRRHPRAGAGLARVVTLVPGRLI